MLLTDVFLKTCVTSGVPLHIYKVTNGMSVRELDMDKNCQDDESLVICLDSGDGRAYLFAENFDIAVWWIEVLRYLVKGFEIRLDEDE